ncbi:MAG: hypothetical protein JWP87_357 [Labilithrix sp.]|nr:hypothetical protein [Labilithrix sp.]
MKRIWGHVVSVFVVGLAVSAVVPACATNDQTIFIRGALAPSQNRVNGICTYTNDATQPELFQARLDVGIADSYFAVLLVGNQLIPRTDPNNNRAESNRVHVTGAVVRVTEADGSLIREFTSPSTGFADPGNNGAAEYGVMGIVGLDAPTRDLILPSLPNRKVSKTVIMNIKAFGQTLGGEDVESGEFQLPMQVCNGCLVDFSTGNDDTSMVQPNCSKPATQAAAANTVPCFTGQDEFVKCESCVHTRPACDPATP